MQRVLFLYLCVLGAFVFVETRPRCRSNNCNHGGGGYGNTGEQYSSQYGYNRQSGYEVDSYNNGGGQSEYSSLGGGDNNGGYSNGGYGNYGSEDGEYNNGGYGSHGSHGGGRYDSSAFIPQDCPNCRINSLGNGNWNTNTFNIPE